MEIYAPAKVNLFLNIIAKREDGYHEIETLFEKISLRDSLTVEPAETTAISCDDLRVPTGKGSLMMNAFDRFMEKAGLDLHFEVKLKKNIPIAAGLGGGSSDAAALLIALNILSGANLSTSALGDIGRTLGSDVPFFLYNSSFAFGKGRGGIIEEVSSSLKMWHVIVTAPFEVSTRDVYIKVRPLSLTKKDGLATMFSSFLRVKELEGLSKNLRNDLQEVALEDFPILRKVIAKMKDSGAMGSLLSGSGSSVFGIYAGEKEALDAQGALSNDFPEKEGWKIVIACTC